MASGRGRYLDRGRTTLALARCRPEWLRSRRLDPAPNRLARCAAAHEEALEIRRHAAARDDHGQAPFVRRCEGEDGLTRRTSPAQSSQQSGREFSSADAATRADHEAFKIVPIRLNGFCQFTIRSRTFSTSPIPEPELCGILGDEVIRRRGLPALG